jgi:hypothetical protein
MLIKCAFVGHKKLLYVAETYVMFVLNNNVQLFGITNCVRSNTFLSTCLLSVLMIQLFGKFIVARIKFIQRSEFWTELNLISIDLFGTPVPQVIRTPTLPKFTLPISGIQTSI